MTPAEREELDANPLWSDEGQILRLFNQQGDDFELLTAAEIANRLNLSQSAVSHVLQRLRRECKARECKAGRRELWGTYDQVVHWLGRRCQEERRLAIKRAAAHAHIVEANNVLADVARQLRKICADHGVAVEIFGGFPRESEEPRKHALVLSVDDPAASSWLLGRLRQVRCIAQRAGELGLLDATRVEVDEHSAVSLTHFTNVQLAEYVFEEAARYRDRPALELAEELDEDPYLSTYFAAVVGMSGRDVLPDLVPAAAALGIAAWCWRNGTAVEAWHVPSDVLMAMINIAVTKVIDEHVDPFEGVDWAGLQPSLTDPAWSLPDGQKVSELFGEGWPEVCDTVSRRLGEWRRLDEDVLGPEATLRLLTIGGSTGYTRHWWGQGRWSAMCRAIVEDAVDGDIALPSPYNELGVERFVSDTAEPDQLSDEVLEWLIDMPAGGVDGPHGIRFHEASRPISRVVEPVEWDTD